MSVAGGVYLLYVVIFFLTRSLNTYGDSWIRTQVLFQELSSIHIIFQSVQAASFNIIYNGFLVNIMPLIACPLWINPQSSNIQMGGLLMKYSLPIMYSGFAGIILVLGLLGIIIYLYRRKYFDTLKIFLFMFFLLFSFTFLLSHLKHFSNREYFYIFKQFRFQYVPNALVVAIALLFLNHALKLTRKIKIGLSLGLLAVILLNIYLTVHYVSFEAKQLTPLNRMLRSIRIGIDTCQINKDKKIFIDDGIVNILPLMSWNFDMNNRFLKKTYQWMFNGDEIKYFSNSSNGAYWVIDKENFIVVKKPSEIEVDTRDNEPVCASIEKERNLIELGIFYAERARHKDAEEVFKEAIEKNPNIDTSYYWLGLLYREHGRYKEAEECFKKALALNPNNAGPYSGLGACYEEQNKYQEVEEMLKRAIELSPYDDSVYVALGHFYNDRKRYPEAEIMFQKAMTLNPYNESLFNGLEACYEEQGRYPEAEEMFRRAIWLNPRHHAAYIVIGHFYNKQKKFTEAESMFTKAVRLGPKNPGPYIGLGICYKEQGRYKEAEECFNKALELSPRNSEAYNALGECKQIQGARP
jgi:tetratricopeptide (TPR) repeat protein